MKRALQAGITLIELLIGMAILVILLAVAGYTLISTGRISNQQDQLITAAGDARLALFRMGEIIRQAGYIYPPGVTISVAGHGTFETGTSALAMLVPANTTYCRLTTSTYCGFLYATVDRDQFVPPLADSGATDLALAEIRVEGIDWGRNAVPALSLTSWSNGDIGLLADGVDSARTNLGGNVFVSTLQAIYDDSTEFRYDISSVGARSLLNGADVVVSLRRNAVAGDATSEQRVEIFTRAVPRSAPPNPN